MKYHTDKFNDETSYEKIKKSKNEVKKIKICDTCKHYKHKSANYGWCHKQRRKSKRN